MPKVGKPKKCRTESKEQEKKKALHYSQLYALSSMLFGGF
jgi:hypothetical protein